MFREVISTKDIKGRKINGRANPTVPAILIFSLMAVLVFIAGLSDDLKITLLLPILFGVIIGVVF